MDIADETAYDESPMSPDFFYNSTDPFYALDGLTYFEIARAIIEVLVILVGNGFVIYVILTRDKLKKIENSYLISLSAIFILKAIVDTPFYVHYDKWIFGELICRLWIQFRSFISQVTVFQLCVILMDRYLAMDATKAPFRHRSKCAVVGTHVATWILGYLFSVFPIIFWKNRIETLNQFHNKKYCYQSHDDIIYNLYYEMMHYFVAAIFMIVVLVLILIAYLRDDESSHLDAEESNADVNGSHITRTTYETWYDSREIVKMVSVTCIFWIAATTFSYILSNLPQLHFNLLLSIIHNNFRIDFAVPIIYVVMNREFKKAFCCNKSDLN